MDGRRTASEIREPPDSLVLPYRSRRVFTSRCPQYRINLEDSSGRTRYTRCHVGAMVRDARRDKSGLLHPSGLRYEPRHDGVRRRHVTTHRSDRRTLAAVTVVAQLPDGRQRNGTRWSATTVCTSCTHKTRRGTRSMKDDGCARIPRCACTRVCMRGENEGARKRGLRRHRRRGRCCVDSLPRLDISPFFLSFFLSF